MKPSGFARHGEPGLLRGWPGGRVRKRDLLALGLGGTVVLATGDEGPVLCPYRRCTGGYCPLCGTSRSAAALVRSDLASAWTRHPLVVLVAIQITLLGIFYASGRTLSYARQNQLLGANAALAVSIWVLRLAVGDIPAPAGLRLPF